MILKEAVSNVINIDAFDAVTVKRMINYMYTGRYENAMKEDQPDDATKDEALSTTVEPSSNSTDDDTPEALDSEDPHADNEPEDAQKEPSILELLLPHIKVNAIADYYAVPKLCHLANVEIQNILDTSWSPCGFSSAIEMATSLTGDTTLPTVLTVAAAENIESLVEANEDIPCLDMANSVIRKLIAANKDTVKNHRGLIRGLKTQNLLLRTQKREGEEARENVEKFRTFFNETSSCRSTSCRAVFPCHIETLGSGDSLRFLLRCTTCRCRHEIC